MSLTKDEMIEIVSVASTIVEALQAAGIHPNVGVAAMKFIVDTAQADAEKRNSK